MYSSSDSWSRKKVSHRLAHALSLLLTGHEKYLPGVRLTDCQGGVDATWCGVAWYLVLKSSGVAGLAACLVCANTRLSSRLASLRTPPSEL